MCVCARCVIARVALKGLTCRELEETVKCGDIIWHDEGHPARCRTFNDTLSLKGSILSTSAATNMLLIYFWFLKGYCQRTPLLFSLFFFYVRQPGHSSISNHSERCSPFCAFIETAVIKGLGLRNSMEHCAKVPLQLPTRVWQTECTSQSLQLSCKYLHRSFFCSNSSYAIAGINWLNWIHFQTTFPL